MIKVTTAAIAVEVLVTGLKSGINVRNQHLRHRCESILKKLRRSAFGRPRRAAQRWERARSLRGKAAAHKTVTSWR